MPLIVLTDSMYPGIHGGDLIICQIKTGRWLDRKNILREV